jgi:hypothetical protein
MFSKFKRSWELGKQSLQVLRQDKQLVVFPLISAAACLAVLASFALPIALTIDWKTLGESEQARVQASATPLYYVVLFAFYFVNYTVIAFFNAALIGCVMRRFDGKEAGVADGLKIAASRMPQILGWALVSSTVGMILRAISEKAGILGKIVIALVGFVWTVATYFVVPVLVVEGVGPIQAVKRSAATIRKTWGEALVTNVGLGAMSFIGFCVAIMPLLIGITLAILADSPYPLITGVGITLVLCIALALITSTLKMILIAALYRYAATGSVPSGFDGQLLGQVFREKKKGKRG